MDNHWNINKEVNKEHKPPIRRIKNPLCVSIFDQLSRNPFFMKKQCNFSTER